MGILVNLPPGLTEGDRLSTQLSKFKPVEVAILGNSKDQILCAIVKFAMDWSGFNDALDFETHFIQNKYGKVDWNKEDCRRDYPYGWLARFDDYHSPGPIGEHLRKNGCLRSVGDQEREGQQEIKSCIANYVCQIEEKKDIWKLEQKKDQKAIELRRVMEEKDRLVQEHNHRTIQIQQAACEKMSKMIEDSRRLDKELMIWQQKKDTRRKQLEDLASKSNIVDKTKLKEDIEKNAKEKESLNSAIQKQIEAHHELFRLLEKQELQEDTNDALRVLTYLERQLDSKHELELEREQLNGELEVRKHTGAEEDTKLQEQLDEMRKKLVEIDEEIEDAKDTNQTCFDKERIASEDLEEAKKEMIRVCMSLEQRSGKLGARSNMLFGVKRMGELDQKAFHDARKERIAKDDFDVEFTLIYSKWEHEIRQPEWYIDAEGKKKINLCLLEKIEEDHEKLQALKSEFGEDAHGLVVKALLEMHEYSPFERDPVPELWNQKEGRKGTIPEAVAYLVMQWKSNKNKNTYR
ncbi:hypothetical protein PVAP13_9NG217300 [Panicum virgatum]|uniref:Factor of DNA methylation 1-5/IDN2 domain-containing protein n=1 Tax=Panicum virgatum TaxID=38727 RepID=A0A8T0MKY4_PANVG|nr:hypothetical protein PVAP13_9NG217300 [Panicum virgatum]KAG2536753.1 hypothetical protein PVAP13_9NG217300 [Panicum virgatum]